MTPDATRLDVTRLDVDRLPDLPVRAVLGAITALLDDHGTAVLVAPPGTGKTTLVPLALAAAGPGKVLVAEPRRLAARAAAARMAALLGEPVGQTVGYAVRGDRTSSAATRIEVVTSGLLLRRLMADPELAGVSTVLLDECHERHLDADLLLALLLDARDGLRPDLRLLATSATVATARLATILRSDTTAGVSIDTGAGTAGAGTAAGDAPVLEVSARTFPVRTRYAPPLRGERIEACVARAVRAALAEGDGDVLAFLPGVAEIRRTAAALSGVAAEVVALHGRLPTAEQDRVLRPADAPAYRRVVLATAVAESSLTVPGVRAVVDAGLARAPRVDHRRGLAGLVTVRVSAAVADQRAGRAGREAPGRVHRCWPESELLARHPEPEIRTADLTRLALDLADWGTPDGTGLRWWDPPPDGPLHAGQEVLRALGALGPDGVITARGRRMAGLGLHPRLARALLDGADAVGARAAAEVVALLDDDTMTAGPDLDRELSALRGGTAPGTGRWRAEVTRLTRLLPKIAASRPGSPSRGRPRADDHESGRGSAALVVALAQPERLARRRAAGSGPAGTGSAGTGSAGTAAYLMAGGTGVEVPAGSDLAGHEWLAVADADRAPGAQNARVRLAAATDRGTAERAAPALLTDADEIGWRDGDVAARRVRRLGAIVLEQRPLARPDPVAVRAALVDGLRSEGLDLLRWTAHARALRNRIATLHRTLGEPWPDVSDAALLADPDRWWSGPLAAARRRADLARVDAAGVLRSVLDRRVAGRLDELAPERVEVPSGSRIALDYAADQPVLAVRLQEVLGWTAGPTVAGGRLPVVLHLLSPAGRPVAVTADLASFWAGPYGQVRSELRGRYPKHEWPLDPFTAVPSRGPRRSPRS